MDVATVTVSCRVRVNRSLVGQFHMQIEVRCEIICWERARVARETVAQLRGYYSNGPRYPPLIYHKVASAAVITSGDVTAAVQ